MLVNVVARFSVRPGLSMEAPHHGHFILTPTPFAAKPRRHARGVLRQALPPRRFHRLGTDTLKEPHVGRSPRYRVQGRLLASPCARATRNQGAGDQLIMAAPLRRRSPSCSIRPSWTRDIEAGAPGSPTLGSQRRSHSLLWQTVLDSPKPGDRHLFARGNHLGFTGRAGVSERRDACCSSREWAGRSPTSNRRCVDISCHHPKGDQGPHDEMATHATRVGLR